jgi:hypothetical protein
MEHQRVAYQITGSPQLGHRFIARKEAKTKTHQQKRRPKMPRPLLVIGKPPCQDTRGLELAQHKTKHRKLRDEIAKLKRSNKLKDAIIAGKDVTITNLANANNYLTKTVQYEDEK